MTGIYCPRCHRYIPAATLRWRSYCAYCGEYLPDWMRR